MSVLPAPSPVFQGVGFGGLPLPGGKLFSYQAGTNTPQATYTDSTQLNQNTNPTILNANGQANVWLVVGFTYKLVLQDFFGNQIWSVDNIPGGISLNLTQQSLGLILYPQTPAEAAINVTPTNFIYPPGNVLRYGAVADGVTNDRIAIKTAFNVMIQQGGGTMVFPWGVTGAYNIVGTDSSPLIPTLQPDFSIANVATPCQLYIRGLNSTRIIFEGSRLTFATTTGGVGIAFDVFSNVRLEKPIFTGQTVMTNAVPTIPGVTAVYLLSLGQNSTGFSTEQFNSVNCFAGIVATGDPAASTRVIGITMEGQSRVLNGEYGYCFQNNGDQVFIEDGYTFALNRPIFIYGASDMNLNIVADSQLVTTTGGGFNGLIKAYSRGTRNIVVNYKILNYYAWSAKFGIESQYNSDIQAAAQMVENVYLTLDEVNNLPFTAALISTATSATLASSPGGASLVWGGSSGTATVKFSDNETRVVTFTNGSSTLSWSGGLTNAVANVATGGAGFHTYFQVFNGSGGTTPQAISALPVFNNIILRGYIPGVLNTNTALNTNAQCQINIDGLTYTAPAAVSLPLTDLFNNNGFLSSRKFTYLPAVSFGGASVGITYGTQSGEYYIAGGLCTVIGTITLTSKGSSTGSAAVAMPFPTRADSSRNPLFTWLGISNMNGLGTYATGFITAAGSAANLVLQGSAAFSNVADTNFTSTSSIAFQASFPL